MSVTAALRHDWTLDEVRALFNQPFNDLLFQAQGVHRQQAVGARQPFGEGVLQMM